METKLLLFASLFFLSFNILSQTISIPDENFEQALIDLGWDTNGLNGTLLESDALLIDKLDIKNPLNNALLPNVSAKIKSLVGIETMVNLVSLEAGNNEISEVDLSKNVLLSSLFLNDNLLTRIDVSKNLALKHFGVMRNQITDLNVAMLVNLIDLFVHNNQITSLDLTNNKELKWLYASNNQLSTINLSNNTIVRRIDIYSNLLVAIDVSMLLDLEDLRVGYNQLTVLDISNNSKLFSFSSNDNNLEVLNVKNGNNSNFTYFSANNNPNLTCIQVDDVAFATANTNWQKDDSASYKTNCSTAGLTASSFLKDNIVIYPNPTISNIQISFSNSIQLQSVAIYNLTGKKLLQHNKDYINLTKLSSGIYFLKISTDKGVLTQKIIKE